MTLTVLSAPVVTVFPAASWIVAVNVLFVAEGRSGRARQDDLARRAVQRR